MLVLVKLNICSLHQNWRYINLLIYTNYQQLTWNSRRELIEKHKYWFPHPDTSDTQGLLSIGGTLEPGRILHAYSQGIFPWFEPGCPILWWSPNPRLIFGESMFHTMTDASKLAMNHLCSTMKDWEFEFIDCQMPTTHLLSLGAKIISRRHFLHMLQLSLAHPDKIGLWHEKDVHA